MKACNPFELYEEYPKALRDSLISAFFKKKFFSGIQVLFGIGSKPDASHEFLGLIDSDIFISSESDPNLVSLFGEEEEKKMPPL